MTEPLEPQPWLSPGAVPSSPPIIFKALALAFSAWAVVGVPAAAAVPPGAFSAPSTPGTFGGRAWLGPRGNSRCGRDAAGRARARARGRGRGEGGCLLRRRRRTAQRADTVVVPPPQQQQQQQPTTKKEVEVQWWLRFAGSLLLVAVVAVRAAEVGAGPGLRVVVVGQDLRGRFF